MPDMKRHKTTLAVVAGVILAASACGSAPAPPATVSITQPPTTAIPPAPPAQDAAEVAALDNSAAFTIRGGALVRLDPQSHASIASRPLPNAMVSISAVAPGGRWVALTDHASAYDETQKRANTTLVVFDTEAGATTRRLTFAADLQPEAFSVDGRLVFALDHRGDHYRVQTIYLATGERTDTSNRDKTLDREDMHGTTVRGVLNADRTVLATLYRDPANSDEPAFVHILDLVHGWAYCADLPAPFGTGPPGSDHIELTPADTVLVTTTQGSRVAEIHIDEVHTSTSVPITVKIRDGSVE
jgi:hypothetical protein